MLFRILRVFSFNNLLFQQPIVRIIEDLRFLIPKSTVLKMMESSSSIREPSFCRIMNRSDELLMPIPSDAAAKMWGVDKGPTNVLIETDEGQTFVVFISEAKGKFFLFNGWSDIVTHLRLKTGCFVIFNPLDATRFKVTYCVNGVSPGYLSYLDLLILRSYDDTLSDLISNIHLSDKTFHVKIETVGGKVCFTNGIDVIISLYQLEPGCYFFFLQNGLVILSTLKYLVKMALK
ncbi:putative transcription factor B3-Domain family [Helianthus annuus]|nr:putative transcription factor B3-Domain family [Helianthus annuus]